MSEYTSESALDILVAELDGDEINPQFAIAARAELAQLRATVTAQAERITALEQAVQDARQQLRATSENWREDCLYRADDILSKAIGDKRSE